MTIEEFDISIADVIIEVVPFSEPIANWLRGNTQVKDALKFSNSESFLPIGAVLTSHSKSHPDDEVIGFIAYDPRKKIFKQDYIVNRGKKDQDFVLYTKVSQDSKSVKHIKKFFAEYDDEGGYERDHHMTLEQLDEKAAAEGKPFLSEMAHSMVRRGTKGWVARPSQEHLRGVMAAITAEKGRRGWHNQ